MAGFESKDRPCPPIKLEQMGNYNADTKAENPLTEQRYGSSLTSICRVFRHVLGVGGEKNKS